MDSASSLRASETRRCWKTGSESSVRFGRLEKHGEKGEGGSPLLYAHVEECGGHLLQPEPLEHSGATLGQLLFT